MIKKRKISDLIIPRLADDKIIVMVGARQVGKTTLLHSLRTHLELQGETVFEFSLEDPILTSKLNEAPQELLTSIRLDPSRRICVLLDEIQLLADPSHFLKYWYDLYRGQVKLIVTGSSAFYIDQKFTDSLAGRKWLFELLTLSFEEMIHFLGDDELIQNQPELSYNQTVQLRNRWQEYLTYGGYPEVVLAPLADKPLLLRELGLAYIKRDLLEAGVTKQDVFYQLLRILAEQAGQLVNAHELAKTLQVDKKTIDYYLYLAEKTYHLRRVRPFFRNLRKELTKMPKAFFLDLGLRNFLVQNFQALDQRPDRGGLLENAVYRRLVDRYGLDQINFWRTQDGHEVDFVVGQHAWEVKYSDSTYKASRYKAFREAYSEIDLQVVTMQTAMVI